MKHEQCYLIADADHPLISRESLLEELILHNLCEATTASLYHKFQELTGINLHPDYPINNLSGGQKVILMVYLCLSSPAERISFRNLDHALDPGNLAALREDIRLSGKVIDWGSKP